jgi:ankyrin repeat protein
MFKRILFSITVFNLLLIVNCYSAMQKAASNNDVSAANQLLEKGNTLDPDEKLALVSAENGSFEFIEFLKSKNYDILEFDEITGRTSLHYTVSPVNVLGNKDPRKDYSQRIKITDFLLRSKANANQEDKYGINPLMTALGGDVLDSFIRISNKEKDLANEKNFPYIDAQAAKKINELEKDISKERENNIKDVKRFNEQKLPISEIVDLLLKAKADPNRISSIDTGNHTPLHLALIRGDTESIKLLIQKKVKLNEKTLRGETPLHMAAQFGNKEAYNQLVAAGADLKVIDNNNLTPYDISPWRIDIWKACAANDIKTIQEYTQSGGSLNAHGFYANSWGWSPLHVAAFEGNLKVAKILLDNGADINIVFHPQGEIGKVNFPFSFSGLGDGLSGLMKGDVMITSPMYFAEKNEKPEMKQFLESQGGVSTIPFGQMANKLGVWNKNKMVGFPGK